MWWHFVTDRTKHDGFLVVALRGEHPRSNQSPHFEDPFTMDEFSLGGALPPQQQPPPPPPPLAQETDANLMTQLPPGFEEYRHPNGNFPYTVTVMPNVDDVGDKGEAAKPGKKRSRCTANEIDRAHKGPVPGCTMANAKRSPGSTFEEGSEGADPSK